MIQNYTNGGENMINLQIIYNAVLPQHDYSPIGTNAYYNDLSLEDGFKLEFVLNNNSLTKKFIKHFNNSIETSFHNRIFTNRYNRPLSEEDTIVVKKEINLAIFDICSLTNNNQPKEFILSESADLETDKLNLIHEHFEDNHEHFEDNVIPKVRGQYWLCLEKINSLVHTLDNKKDARRSMVVIRLNHRHDNEFERLTDDEYNSFKSPSIHGNLYLDYATVGKDLQACWETNDLHLIKEKKVSPQLYNKPYFNFSFWKDKKESKTKEDKFLEHREIYYNWCKKNNIIEYYDYTLPIHNTGRAVIGQLKEDITYDTFVEETKKYPHINSVRIIYENE